MSQTQHVSSLPPTGSRGLPPAKAWQDWFAIRLRTWGQREQSRVRGGAREEGSGSASGSVAARHSGQTTRTRDRFHHRRQDAAILAWTGSVVGLCDSENEEIRASTAEHTTARHERFAKPVSCRDKTKLLLTLRPQGVAGGRKLAIQRDSDAIPQV